MIPILLILLASCSPPHRKVSTEGTKIKVGTVYTVTHDGHSWVIWEGSQKGTMLHHPDCPKCGKDTIIPSDRTNEPVQEAPKTQP